MIRVKEAGTIFVGEGVDGTDARFKGVFHRDTCYFSDFSWTLPALEKLAGDPVENTFVEQYALIGGQRLQIFDIERVISVLDCRVTDTWTITNVSQETAEWSQALQITPELADLFRRMVPEDGDGGRPIQTDRQHGSITWRRETLDGMSDAATLECADLDETLRASFDLAAGESREISVSLTLSPGQSHPEVAPLPTYPQWRQLFPQSVKPQWQAAYARAIDDMRLMLLSTEFGLYPAAGVPWFGNKFGRDALITAMMISNYAPDVLKGVLSLLAAKQGAETNPFNEEEPGKILHEIREGELSRAGRIPFAKYYGSVDSTALFVMAFGKYVSETGDLDFAKAQLPALYNALVWLEDQFDGPTGLLRFEASGSGLVVQSWKDSHDSMNHADGAPAPQPLAVAEVQGYAFAAMKTAEKLFGILGKPDRAKRCEERATSLQQSFHERYWLPHLKTYAMALDRDLKPLEVQSSDPGHLLWSGIVPVAVAKDLANTLMSEELWSGWGLRTLGSAEARYAPSSYHNGSVWPHDTALFAAGLAAYGFQDHYETARSALFDLAMNLEHHRIPELISGHSREDMRPPVRYGHASNPQAWAAAGLIMLAHLEV